MTPCWRTCCAPFAAPRILPVAAFVRTLPSMPPTHKRLFAAYVCVCMCVCMCVYVCVCVLLLLLLLSVCFLFLSHTHSPRSHVCVVGWLWAACAHLDMCLQGFTALDRAVAGDHKDAVRYLLARPGIKPKQECMKMTPLKRAVESKSDDPYILRLLAETQVQLMTRAPYDHPRHPRHPVLVCAPGTWPYSVHSCFNVCLPAYVALTQVYSPEVRGCIPAFDGGPSLLVVNPHYLPPPFLSICIFQRRRQWGALRSLSCFLCELPLPCMCRVPTGLV